MERKQLKVLGYNVDLFSYNDAIDYTKYLLDSEYSVQVVTINPEMIEFALKNENFSHILNKAELVIPDGMGIKLALLINGVNQQRIPGIEYSKKVLEICEEKEIPVAFIGSTKQVVEKAAENIKAEMPNIKIVYTKDGFFQSDEEGQIINDLKESGARFILVALGSPKQEYFIDTARLSIKNALWVGVGGSFDVWSGIVKRAPVIFRKLGLEWLYRVIDNPKRISRIFPTLPIFLYRVIINKILPSKR
ncbi:WecB/TagA/CpsF family glycosyltransferase [bacterium]|nr:WecB/TagA/CpsF family glycosyltransferase [bacterium]